MEAWSLLGDATGAELDRAVRELLAEGALSLTCPCCGHVFEKGELAGNHNPQGISWYALLPKMVG